MRVGIPASARRHGPRTAVVLLLLVVLGSRSSTFRAARAEEREPAPPAPTANSSHAEVAQYVDARLHEVDLGTWVLDLSAEPLPTEPGPLFLRIQVLLRAGHLMDLDPLLAACGRLSPSAQRDDLTHLTRALHERRAWREVRTLVEHAPHAGTSDLGDFLKALETELGLEDMDRWLAARGTAPSTWVVHRAALLARRGGESGLLKQLQADVVKQPEAIEPALVWVQVKVAVDLERERAIARRGSTDAPSRVPAGWLGITAKPRLAIDCWRLAQALRSDPAEIPLLERAVSLPVTPEDLEHGRMSFTAGFRGPTVAQQFHGALETELMRAYHRHGQAAAAQRLLERLTARTPDGLPFVDMAEFSGQVQAASGMRVIEGHIRDAEERDADSARYWLMRARYYEGRKERVPAKEAFLRALEIAPRADPTEHDPRRIPEPERAEVASHYVGWLHKNESKDSARAFAWAEFEAAAPGTRLSEAMANDLTHLLYYNLADAPGAEDDVAWRLLSAVSRWDHMQSTLLGRMLPKENAEAFWTRAEGLAHGRHTSRAFVLGRLLSNSLLHLRAARQYEDAAARAEDGFTKIRALGDLFRVRCRLDHWRSAADLLPSLLAAHHVWESDALKDLALASARAGAKDEAVRFWRRRANLNRGQLDGLSELSRLGLFRELHAYYVTLAQREPTSVDPPQALVILASAK